MTDHRTHQIDDYMDGLLSDADVAAIDNHLRLCDVCRTEFDRMKRLREQTSGLPRSIKPERDLWPGVKERITAGTIIPLPTDAGPRHEPPSLPRTGLSRALRTVAAVAAVLAMAAVGVWWYLLDPGNGWSLAVRQGTAWLGSRMISGETRISVGETLKTGEASSALIEVGLIGHVDVEANTSIRLVQATLTNHRLALEKGTISARIFAPPRLFFVETPSALAVDLGCAYTLSVDDSGKGLLSVTSGWVALEYDGRSSVVPAGAVCRTKPGFGPGTPYQHDASARLVEALERLDFSGVQDALDVVLAEARNMDSITLWHLFLRSKGTDREKIYDRLASLVKPPAGVTREGMLAGDRNMTERWQSHLNLGMDSWWRSVIL